MPSVERIHVEEGHGDEDANIIGGNASARSRLLNSLVYSGSLDSFKHQDLTPVIGREFEGLQVTDLLRWGDEMIRDLAITGMAFPSLQPKTKSLGLTYCSQFRNVASSSSAIKMSHRTR